uniref:Uncharacterized protein n=1 Tax=Ditylenchus dipsaci TaxID=166011 RepID=A0A915ESC8_9BILA
MEHNFNANTAFLINWPHGILKAVHWFSSLITLLFVHNRAYLIWFSENIQYDFPGYQLVLFTAYTFFIYSFVSWMAHFTGVLKVKSGDNQQEGNVWKLAEIDMWICTGFTVLYLTSIVICLMAYRFFTGWDFLQHSCNIYQSSFPFSAFNCN